METSSIEPSLWARTQGAGITDSTVKGLSCCAPARRTPTLRYPGTAGARPFGCPGRCAACSRSSGRPLRPCRPPRSAAAVPGRTPATPHGHREIHGVQARLTTWPISPFAVLSTTCRDGAWQIFLETSAAAVLAGHSSVLQRGMMPQPTLVYEAFAASFHECIQRPACWSVVSLTLPMPGWQLIAVSSPSRSAPHRRAP